MTAKEQLKAISQQTHDLVHVQYSTLNRSLVPALEKAGLHVIFEHEAFSEKQKEFVDRYFEDNVYPVLTARNCLKNRRLTWITILWKMCIRYSHRWQ